jgi:hypothetical protein
MKTLFEKVWGFVHSKDLYTWIGHGLMGFVLAFFFGVTFVAGAFVYREASDILSWWAKPGAPGIDKPAFAEKARDGFFDLWAPLAGAAIAMILKG